ncbi:FtsW/RodA/SpoVE family cell cycle protein [Clostridium sp. OS1-26]|uniref:FtsW/RodA/SpoVE family cell cycle protein n=1 Tax=Clostridium sp. OS1-26 TaxID=3070681 RepID=UPI0027E11893|nr:FtsW/RodA/SpoVE family cell cycle protein [Clostridium sp. OS1-26]WML37412.1 FtsW/RodA/SpoVE family cell cycle protein [Clostridium sp. OS1-26]
MLRYTYILCFVCFLNLSILKQPFDKGAMVMAAVICVLIGYSYFIIRKFFCDGDKYIFIFSSILSILGMVVLYRINMSYSIKQIIWFAVGVTEFILIVVLLPDLKDFSKYKYHYCVITLFFMAMATFFGTEINGSKNWIVIHGYSFQPSEFGKLFLVIYLAAELKDYKCFKDLIRPCIVVGICIGFMLLQKSLGFALIIFFISITMIFIATSKLKYILVSFILFAIGCVISYKLFAHVRVRVLIWKDPWPYANTISYQVVQSMISIASGGLTGVGLGLGHPEFVPINYTDFIFSIICEELGILTGFAIIIINFLLFYRCMRVAVYEEDKFLRLLVVGYSAMIASQILVIIGGVINAIPLTGITLPLVSYGGSSILSIFFSLGIIQKISEGVR